MSDHEPARWVYIYYITLFLLGVNCHINACFAFFLRSNEVLAHRRCKWILDADKNIYYSTMQPVIGPCFLAETTICCKGSCFIASC